MKRVNVRLIIDIETDLSDVSIASARRIIGPVPEVLKDMYDAIEALMLSRGYTSASDSMHVVNSEVNGGLSSYQVFYRETKIHDIEFSVKIRVSNHTADSESYERNMGQLVNEDLPKISNKPKRYKNAKLDFLDMTRRRLENVDLIYVGGKSGYQAPVHTVQEAINIFEGKLNRFEGKLS